MAALDKSLIGGYLPIQVEGNIKLNRMSVWIDPAGESGYVVGPPAADSDPWAGVPDVDIADEEDGSIAIDGIVNCVIHATVTTKQELMMDVTSTHEGKLIPATTGKQVVAIACQGGASGDTIAVRLCRYIKP